MASKKTESQVAAEKNQKTMNAVRRMTAFYRENPHRFAKDYLNIQLRVFQKILIVMMNVSTNFMFIAARGLGKSYLIAVFCVIRCILYPGTSIVLASRTKKQAAEIIGKITNILMPQSENLCAEIKEVVDNQTKCYVEFWNTSKITVVASNDNSRGYRANILVLDEFRMISKDIIDIVLHKFLATPRQPGFLKKAKYKDYPLERNKEFYLSSAWYSSHWSYRKMLTYATNMLDYTKQYFLCAFPYELSIKEKLLDRQQVADEMSEADFNQITFDMEMSCMWQGQAEGALFDFNDVSKTRKLKLPVYPKEYYEILNEKSFKYIQKAPKEVRLLAADIGLMGSKKHSNDAASIFILSLTPHYGRYMCSIIYSENVEDIVTGDLALKLRRYFDWFECDYLVQDTMGNGLGVFDSLIQDIYDSETGDVYPAINCFNNDEMAARCKIKTAPRVICSIKASERFNSDCALMLREGFKSGKIRMLINELDSEEEQALGQWKSYKGITEYDKVRLMMPYMNTSLLVNELINLKYEPKASTVKVYEKSGFRKDRYSALAYGYWWAIQLELKLDKEINDVSEAEFNFRRPKSKKDERRMIKWRR